MSTQRSGTSLSILPGAQIYNSQNIQKALVKVGSAVDKSTDTFLTIRANPDKFFPAALAKQLGNLVTYNMDAIALLGHVIMEMFYCRHNAIKWQSS